MENEKEVYYTVVIYDNGNTIKHTGYIWESIEITDSKISIGYLKDGVIDVRYAEYNRGRISGFKVYDEFEEED